MRDVLILNRSLPDLDFVLDKLPPSICNEPPLHVLVWHVGFRLFERKATSLAVGTDIVGSRRSFHERAHIVKRRTTITVVSSQRPEVIVG